MRKQIISTLLACGILTAFCGISASAAADGLTIKLDEVGEATGYYIKGYYGSDESNLKEVSGTKKADGTYYFPGVKNNDDYSMFYYELYNSDGEVVVDRSVAYIGDLAYADPNKVIDISAPVTYEEIYAYNLEQSGIDSSDYLASLEEPVNKPVVTEPALTQPEQEPEIEIKAGVGVNITSVYDISLIMPTNGIKIYVTDSNDVTTCYEAKGLTNKFQLLPEIESGSYTVQYASGSTAYKKVEGTNSFNAQNGVNMLDVAITPTCLLTVKSANNRDFTIAGVNRTYNTRNGVIAVAPGTSYRVTASDTGVSFDIAIPSTATECVLDLDTASGVPTNDKAYQDAVLDKTASEDNPYNIPPTNDTSSPIEVGVACSIPIIAAIAALIVKKRSDY